MQAKDLKNTVRHTNLISAFHQESRSRYRTLENRDIFLYYTYMHIHSFSRFKGRSNAHV